VYRKSAARASSMTRASHADVIDIIVADVVLTSSPGVSTGRAPPTARIHVCGGLMTAENDEMPNIPRFDMLQQNMSVTERGQFQRQCGNTRYEIDNI